MKNQHGFTILELLIAVTLVAAISAGLLTAMRNGLLTMERTQHRLTENRRALGLQDLVARQIAGAVPILGLCGTPDSAGSFWAFRGHASALMLVTNASLAQGSRGYPHVVSYHVLPNRDGTVRLEMTEALFPSPAGTIPFCDASGMPLIPATTTPPTVIYDRLAYCTFSYQIRNPGSLLGTTWMEDWYLPQLPAVVRIELAAAPGSAPNMPVRPITIPLHLSWTPGEYHDDY
jgi:prepilin-type N-terminal cleavage/methylation domain-containing protein